ncbi:MAG: ABC transporter substrate-binding protein [Planctomycetaceae bacterium]|jgi:peptide/nickel transport system substrate-binding protein|nr:ABC transporter substrate-binding protein [Planctomycetaceae bacterium]MBT6487624.1 ABC transporter substrate-binding protein [Planctomycetaceae bacterium]
MKDTNTMCNAFRCSLSALALALCWFVAGCSQSAPPAGGGTKTTNGSSSSDSETGSKTSANEGSDAWEGYADVPYVPVMQDVDGIEIPRVATNDEKLSVKGAIPADVGNKYAKEHPGKPVTGDWLTVRFSSEPKTLNPIVETSAVQSYIGEYVNEALVRQNPETLEYEPHIAERWVTEDSVKLSPDYPGKERRVALAEGKPATTLELEFPKTAKDAEPAVVKLQTSDVDGQPTGKVWVGLYPVSKIPGAPAKGYHFWSNDKGQLDVSAVIPGKYTVKVGTEIFGVAVENEDGSLTVTPETPNNPLNEELKSSGEKSLTIAKGKWVDVQRETIYTYFLKPEVKWSDGTPFTTKDLEFSYAVINNEYVDGESLRVYYQDLLSCEALDANTVRMQYRQQYFKAFEFTVGLSAYAPAFHQFAAFFKEDGKTLTLEKLTPEEETAQKKVSAHGQVFGKFFNTDDRYNLKPMGTGPYTVAKWERDNRVELHRNPDYWNPKRAGHLDRLIFRFIADNGTALQSLRAGDIDFMYRMSPEQYFEELAGPPEWIEKKYVKASWYSPGFSYYGWNILKPKFRDRRVRIALSLLFDKQEFLEKKLHNAGVVVAGSQYFFGPACDHTVKPLGYDPDTAAELLADAGWIDTDNDGILDKDGEKFAFELIFPPGSASAAARAAIIQKSYKDAGIQMSIRNYEWASFIDKVKAKDYDAVNLGWAMALESDPFQIWHGSQAGADKRGSNHVSFSDPQADELIEMLRLTLDKEKRMRIHWSFQRILDREQPYMFLYTSKDFGAYDKRFQGVKWYRLRPGFDFTEWYVPKDQQVH